MKKLLVIFGSLEIIYPAIALYTLLPLVELQLRLGTDSFVPFIGIGFFVLAMLVALTQIVIVLFSLEKKVGKRNVKRLFISGLVLALLIIPAVILFIINPIYALSSSLLNQ